MAVDILLPQIGPAMSAGRIGAWLVGDGAAVVEGQPLFSLEADASGTAIEAPASGTLRIIARTGAVYEVGAVLGYIT